MTKIKKEDFPDKDFRLIFVANSLETAESVEKILDKYGYYYNVSIEPTLGYAPFGSALINLPHFYVFAEQYDYVKQSLEREGIKDIIS